MSPREQPMSIRDRFTAFARKSSEVVGSPWASVLALTTIVVWAVSGPLFGFSDTWQLVINTGTTVVTFIMVFLIQSTQNHDAKAMHLKLDELIRAVRAAHNEVIDLEDLPEHELDALARRFAQIQRQANGSSGGAQCDE